jgi:hypothetical protein
VLTIKNLIELIGYEFKYVSVFCDLEVAIQRNENRSINNISAYYCEDYHYKWIEQIVKELLNE